MNWVYVAPQIKDVNNDMIPKFKKKRRVFNWLCNAFLSLDEIWLNIWISLDKTQLKLKKWWVGCRERPLQIKVLVDNVYTT